WGVSRSLGIIRYKSPDLLGYLLAPESMNDLYVAVFQPTWIRDYHQRTMFPGLVLPLLMLAGAWGAGDTLAPSTARQLRHVFGAIGVAGLVLSLGPVLIAFGYTTPIPLPYRLLYEIVPGWSAMQTPHRFTILALLGASMLAVLGVMRCGSIVQRWRGW